MSFFYNTSLLNLNNIKTPNINFRANTATYIGDFKPQEDSFATNPLERNLFDKDLIEKTIKQNKKQFETDLNGYPLKINMKALEELKRGHLMDTRVTVAKMYSALPPELKAEINLPDLQQAAMLHDYGKVLIPENILNKNDELTDAEREIMEKHSELSYELLKNNGVNERVLNLIKYHHQNKKGTGYPEVNKNFEYTIAHQILSTADKYSALREKRSYKDAMSHEQALKVIHEDVAADKIDEEVYNALSKML